jgi:hypothetical protein
VARLSQTLRDAARGLPALSVAGLGVLLKRPRQFVELHADFLRLRRSVLGRDLPAITPRELLEFEGCYSVRFGDEGMESNHLEDLLLLKLVAMMQPRRVFEIGTFIGTRTLFFASQGPADMEIFTLDLPPDAPISEGFTDLHMIERSRTELGRRFRDTRYAKNVTQLFGDSMSFDFSPYHGSIDLVYIDGSHSYEYVRSDTLNAFSMLRPDGIILWDDYGSVRSEYGTTEYPEKLRALGFPVYRLGPPEARNALRARAVLRADKEALERALLERP